VLTLQEEKVSFRASDYGAAGKKRTMKANPRYRSGILVGLLLATLVSPRGLVAQSPRIELSAAQWDFGVREQGDTDRFIVKVKNMGDAPLILRDLKVTCGCVNATMANRGAPIPPGGERDLVLTLVTARQRGKVQKYCYVSSNDPKTPQAVITITGEILGDWRVEPKHVNFGIVRAGRTPEATFRVEVRPGRTVEILDIIKSSDDFSLERVPYGKLEAPHGWRIKVRMKDDVPPGPFSAAVHVRTGNRNLPYENVMLHARVQGELEVRPGKIYFGRVLHGSSRRAIVRLRRKDDQAFVVSDEVALEGFAQRIHAKVMKRKEGRLWEVLLTLAPTSPDDRMKGRVRLLLEGAGQRAVAIPWQAVSGPERPGR